MKIINRIIPLLFLCFELVCYSQESKDTRTAIDNKEYDNFVSCQRKRNLSQFTEYRFPDEIDKMKDSDVMSGIYHALGSNFYNWIGAYSKALELASITGKNNKPNDEELSYFNMFYPVSARQNILSRIQDESLIIFNEAHDKPQHRVFVTSMLKELFNEGFELLFLEALNPNDTLINNRGYPTKTSGLYLKDPQFGNLVREALKIGFTIHPYESKTHEDDKEREYNQAKNISRIVKESGDKKAVVYCGYDHAMENLTTKSHGKMMANHLKEILGIDPLTISQYQLTESFNSEDNNPYFNAIKSNEPSILVDNQGNSFAGSSEEPWCDIWLYHPKTQYVHSRPKWLGWVQNKKWVDIPKYHGDLTFPVMVLAYSVDEDKEDAIPIDIVILEDGSTKKKMSLFAHGSYDLIYMDSNNQCFSKRMSTN